MGLVVDLARPANPPTNGQYVSILQSAVEPHIETVDTDGGTITAPPLGLPAADDRAHQTGDDAIAYGSNLVTSTFLSFTVAGDVTDASPGLAFGGSTPGTEASAKQALSGQITEGQEVLVSFDMLHTAGPGLYVGLYDSTTGVKVLGGVVASHYKDTHEVSHKHMAFVCPVTTAGASLWFVDDSGNFIGDITAISVAVRNQSV